MKTVNIGLCWGKSRDERFFNMECHSMMVREDRTLVLSDERGDALLIVPPEWWRYARVVEEVSE